MAHPLTDEICDQIQDSIHPCDPEDMRAAADWQLAQDAESFKNFLVTALGVPLDTASLAVQSLWERMRPSTEENN